MSDKNDPVSAWLQADPAVKEATVRKLLALVEGAPTKPFRHYIATEDDGPFEVFHRSVDGEATSAKGDTLEAAWEALGELVPTDDWTASPRLVDMLQLADSRVGAPNAIQRTTALFDASQRLDPELWTYPWEDVQGLMLEAFASLARNLAAYNDGQSYHYWADLWGDGGKGSLPVSIHRSGATLHAALLFDEAHLQHLAELGGTLDQDLPFDAICFIIDASPHWFADVTLNLLGVSFRAEPFWFKGGQRERAPVPQAMMLGALANAAPASPNEDLTGGSAVVLDNLKQLCSLERV